MTVDELISALEELRDDLGGDFEVRLMTQQSWPFENAIRGLTTRGECEMESDEQTMHRDCVFIVEGRQICYGNKAAWESCIYA